MGAETYSWIMSTSPDDWPYQNAPAFVITSRDLPVPSGLEITLLQGDAGAITKKVKQAAKGKDVWLVGGGKTAAYFAEAGDLPQLFITTLPIFLGTGVAVLPVGHNVSVIPKVQRILQ
ncbi:dihydrofolate reductase family protein, partial [Pseudomonas sp. D47]|uniref:dihydrofolate reductase family protein n=1 Tax=Pseudomonas sp. D47 TaxID=3159447 RepID=UPI00387B3DCD